MASELRTGHLPMAQDYRCVGWPFPSLGRAPGHRRGLRNAEVAIHPADPRRMRRKVRGLEVNPKRRASRSAPDTDGSLGHLNEFEAGEEIADFKGGGIGSVGAVGAIVADAGAEVVADGAGGGFFGVGGAHGVAPF
jgi:hypothetical protein